VAVLYTQKLGTDFYNLQPKPDLVHLSQLVSMKTKKTDIARLFYQPLKNPFKNTLTGLKQELN